MAVTPVQNIDIINAYERLTPGDASLESPSFDPGTLTPTYSIDPGWVSVQPVGGYSAVTGLNGINGSWTDLDIGTMVSGTQPVLANQRYWQAIGIRLWGGGTASYDLHVQLVGPKGSFTPFRFKIVNPATSTFGPLLVPASNNIKLYLDTTGHASDYAQVYWTGVQSETGVALPLLPAFTHISDTGI